MDHDGRARLYPQQWLALCALPHRRQQLQDSLRVRPDALRQALDDLVEQAERLPRGRMPFFMCTGVNIDVDVR